MYYSRIPALFAAGLLALAFSHPATAVRVKGEQVKAVAKSAPLALRSSNFPSDATASLGFSELATKRIADLQRRNQVNA